jgi:hypothetical protein
MTGDEAPVGLSVANPKGSIALKRRGESPGSMRWGQISGTEGSGSDEQSAQPGIEGESHCQSRKRTR